ncbi:hypothetical protein GBAR_LOCUS4019 [Geodia barretti]|uniref:Uncharacterized protein n=1 Tax=Geodia barretti TaxID=519541 RepID=A0AA35W5T1_GEOBA|nr:hypothetical protein GBAR_LOCUS4019 [Geodia barretti]
MSDFKSRLEGGEALSLLRALGEGDQRWLFYTDFSESECIWQIRCCLRDGEVQVIPGASHLSLCLKLASQPLQLQLSELTCLQNQDQLRGLIFELWTRLNAAQSQLADYQRQQEDCRHDKGNKAQDLVLVDASRSSRSGSSRAKRPAGASLVNPNMKRRKAVKGVVFGDSQDEC